MRVAEVEHLHEGGDGSTVEHFFRCLGWNLDAKFSRLISQISVLHVLLDDVADSGDEPLLDHLTDSVREDIHQIVERDHDSI